MAENVVHQTTPGAEILETLSCGAKLLQAPADHQTLVIEAPTLPEEVDYPQSFPRVYNIINKIRSTNHAHRPGSEQELMVVLTGEATVYLWDRNAHLEKVTLRPAAAGEKFIVLYIPTGIWHTVKYEPGTILQVCATVCYNRDDYIEDPAEFFVDEDAVIKYGRSYSTEGLNL